MTTKCAIWEYQFGRCKVTALAEYRSVEFEFTDTISGTVVRLLQPDESIADLLSGFRSIAPSVECDIRVCYGFYVAMTKGDEYRDTPEKRRSRLSSTIQDISQRVHLTDEEKSSLQQAARIVSGESVLGM